MPHSTEEKKRALARVQRVRGQIDALERALLEGADCGPVLQQIAAVRGAINGLMASVLESHMREQFAPALATGQTSRSAVDDMTALVRSYLR
jgi:DNA-binding FrmR family transcriptional regulator